MSMGRRIAQARKEAGLSQQAVANRFGISRAAVAQWENGDTFPGSAKLEGLAEVLRVSLEWLATGRGNKFAAESEPQVGGARRTVPVIAAATAAGWPEHGRGSELGQIVTDLELGPDAFAIIIEDQSMAPEFAEGDKVILDPAMPPRARDFVVAAASPEDGPVFRMYRPSDRDDVESIELVPFSSAWPTQVIDSDNPGRILGTMVEHRRYRRS
jgi:transcriptional regulator with XRE-family HTH domain